MKKTLILCYAIALTTAISTRAFAQNVIALEHSGATTMYQNLDTALTHAVSGDILYLPPASYNISNLIINKGVNIVGAGCNADSSGATGITLFNGNIYVLTGSDNGSIEGIYINGSVYFGTAPTDQTVNMFSINRCYIASYLDLSFDGSSSTSSTNIFINENILRGLIYCGYAQNIEFSKNLIDRSISFVNGNTVIENNVFLDNGCGEYVLDIAAATVRDNIFLATYCGQYWVTNRTSNTFSNNLFTTADPLGASPKVNNIFNVPHDSIFVTQAGYSYDILHNYHLRPTCAGKNAGTDGTDIGLFGTASPKKDGEIPYNPHIQTLSIPTSTDSQGNLNINIKVKAQDN